MLNTLMQEIYVLWKKCEDFIWFVNEHKYGISEDKN
jgi:hypothetical protein